MTLAGIIALVITFAAASLIDRLARRYHVGLAIPRERDLHSEPTPRFGGVAIYLGVLLTTIIWLKLRPADLAAFNFPFAIFGLSIDKRLLGILLAMTIVVAVGAYDDLKGLSATAKLIGQVVAGMVVVASSVELESLRIPFWHMVQLNVWQIPLQIGSATYHITPIADLLLVFWLVLLMNAMNFLDGIDGLATSIASIATITIILLALSVTVHQPAVALFGFILLGSLFGFLPWNWHQARLFLGDSGSMLLGFLLGVLSVISGGKIATLALVLGLPILDLGAVVIGRLLKKQNPFVTADQSHLHHRLVKAGFSVPQTVFLYTAVAAVVGSVALSTTTNGKFYALFVLLLFLCVVIGLLSRSIGWRTDGKA